MNVDLKRPDPNLPARVQYRIAYQQARYLNTANRSVHAYMQWVSAWGYQQDFRHGAVESLHNRDRAGIKPFARNVQHGLHRLDHTQQRIRWYQQIHDRAEQLRKEGLL